MADSRRKGHNYERQIATWYRERNFDVERGRQSRGATNGEADLKVHGLPYWIECAVRKHGNWIFDKWKQAERDAAIGKRPLLHVHRTNGPHLVVMDLQAWDEILANMGPATKRCGAER